MSPGFGHRSLPRIRERIRRIRRHFSRRALILLYHRINEADTDPWQLAVTPRHFAEHLQVLRRFGRPTPICSLSAGLRGEGLPRRAVLVTFDDGYADNLLQAKPLLEEYDVPATVFITTGYTGADREFWWDELDRLFLQPGALPGVLRLVLNGNKHAWWLGRASDYDEASYYGNLQWRGWYEDDPTPRHSVYRSLWQLMQPMSECERQQARTDLLAWAGASASARPTHRPLTSEEIIELARSRLIEIGCHTVTHPQLSALSAESQRDEISKSKEQLEEILGRPVTSFAYPYGRERDYTGETAALLQEAGFDCACTASAQAVDRNSDPFQLPRVQVTDMDGESFSHLLSGWLRD
jgi:peptidoglycan/xylan/chitin deacetylase (PgdA/CDA1 family)